MKPKHPSRHKKLAKISRSSRAIKIPKRKEGLSAAKTAYFAGLIDGEAWVALAKNSFRKVPIWNVPTIVISMTDYKTILACACYFQCGCVHLNDTAYRRTNGKHKQQYTWTVRWNDARRVAAMIYPYSITKKVALKLIVDLPVQVSGPIRSQTPRRVKAIRSAYNRLGSYEKVGKKYGIATMTAWKIVNRKMYAEIE